MAERLGVNIFSGVLPTSYLFVDDGSDASKWQMEGAPCAFTSITPGAAYGYYGQGLEFRLNDAVGAATYPAASRPIILSPIDTGVHSRVRLYGFVARFTNDFFTTAATQSRQFHMVFQHCLGDPTTDMPRVFGIRLTPVIVGVSAIRSIRVAIMQYNGDAPPWNTEVATDLSSSTNNISGMLDAAGIKTPWIRVEAIVQDRNVVQVRINGTPNVVSVPTSAAHFYCGGNRVTYASAAIVAFKKTDADKVDFSAHVDQIWASELDYRV